MNHQDIKQLTVSHTSRKNYMDKERFQKAKTIIDQMEVLGWMIEACKDKKQETLVFPPREFSLVRKIIAKFAETELDEMMAQFKKI